MLLYLFHLFRVWAGMDMSLPFTIDDPMDTWQPRSLVGTVPEGVEIVQVGMMLKS